MMMMMVTPNMNGYAPASTKSIERVSFSAIQWRQRFAYEKGVFFTDRTKKKKDTSSFEGSHSQVTGLNVFFKKGSI